MLLTSLILQNFRSYHKTTFRFPPGTAVIVGQNAAGKTNVLEAIMMLATGKSFRAGMDREMIQWGSEIGRISGETKDTVVEIVLTSGIVSGQKVPFKKFLVNGVSRRVIDVLGTVRAVLFWPEDLDIITDSPSTRRKYLDTVLVQVDREYRRNLLSYERGLRQRNKLLGMILDGKASRNQLIFWNQLLIKAGNDITKKRDEYISFVNRTELTDHKLQLSYDKSIISEQRLLQYGEEEIAAKSTLVGPHRDDFTVLSGTHDTELANGLRDLGVYGSRGEQRLAVLWLKLAELSYAEAETGDRPLLLLDDIFSELDEGHRALIGSITEKQQTIITSAERGSIPEGIMKHAHMIEL